MKRLCELTIVFVASASALRLMMNDLECQSLVVPDWHLSVDFEGVNLSRHGEICIGQFAGKNSRTVYVVDFVNMNPFTAEPRLKAMLASERVLKLLFDPRNDADALYWLYGVALKSVLCLQLADAAHLKARGLRCRYVRGLAAATQSVPLSVSDRSELARIKHDGNALYCPDQGGSFEVFKQRPLGALLLQYCAVDVYFFDDMKAALFDGLSYHWKLRVTERSRERQNEWTKTRVVQGRHRAVCPL